MIQQCSAVSFHTFMSPLGKTGAPNLCPGELTLFSPPELCLGVGHLSGATGERPLQTSLNPGESIDASMAAGLSFTQVPQGRLLISINVKWCRPQANTEKPHTPARVRVCVIMPTSSHIWVYMYADVVKNWLSSGQNREERPSDVVKWQASEWNICLLDAVDSSLLLQ